MQASQKSVCYQQCNCATHYIYITTMAKNLELMIQTLFTVIMS